MAGWRKGEFLGCCPNLGARGVTEHFSVATWGRSRICCHFLFLHRTGSLASTVWSPEKVFLTVISLWNARGYGHIDDLISKHCGFVCIFSYLQYATEYKMLLRNTTSGNVTWEKVRSLLRFLYKPLSTVIFDYSAVLNPFQQSLERNKYFSLPGTETHASQMSYPQPHKKATMDRRIGLNWSDSRPYF